MVDLVHVILDTKPSHFSGATLKSCEGLRTRLHVYYYDFVNLMTSYLLSGHFVGVVCTAPVTSVNTCTVHLQMYLEPKIYLWTLGHADLTSRFVSTCNMAVEWAMHGVEPYTSEHAQYLQDEEVVMPATIVLDHEANIAQADVAFLHFLLNYFHRALQPLLRKVHSYIVLLLSMWLEAR